jgi:hypothetical protein
LKEREDSSDAGRTTLPEDGLSEALLHVVASPKEDPRALTSRVLAAARLGRDEDGIALNDEIL